MLLPYIFIASGFIFFCLLEPTETHWRYSDIRQASGTLQQNMQIL